MGRGLSAWGEMGTLYVVGTPIGNLEDVSPRAIRTLREVSLIAAEDTRHTAKLLTHFGISTPMTSYHAFNERFRRGHLLAALADGDVALVTDAGTPGISDPGVELVDAVLDVGFPVKAIPGPSSLTSAASTSGLLTGPFTFLGFLPRKSGERRKLIALAASTGFGVVLFESPNRLVATLRELTAMLAGRRFAVARELTKVHETVERGAFDPNDDYSSFATLRGEVVVVVEMAPTAQDTDDAEATLIALLQTGLRATEAARLAARMSGLPRSELYKLAIEFERKSTLDAGGGAGQPD